MKTPLLSCGFLFLAAAAPHLWAQSLPASYVRTKQEVQSYVASQGDFTTVFTRETIKPAKNALADAHDMDEVDQDEGKAKWDTHAFFAPSFHDVNLSTHSSAFSSGNAATAPPYPENSRIFENDSTATFKDRLTIRSSTTIASVVLKITFHIEGMLEYVGTNDGGDASINFGIVLGDFGPPGYRLALGVGDGSKDVDEDMTFSIPGKIGPNGFVPQDTLITPPYLDFTAGLSAPASVPQYLGNFVKNEATVTFTGFQFEDGTGKAINPAKISVKSASGLNYNYFALVPPLEASPAQFHGSSTSALESLAGAFDALLHLGGGYTGPAGGSQLVAAKVAAAPAPSFTLTGKLAIGAGTFSYAGFIAADGSVTFKPGNVSTKVFSLPGGKTLELTLSLQDIDTAPKLVGQIKDPATGDTGTIAGDYSIYRVPKSARPNFPAVPDTLLGTYELALPPAPVASQTLTADKYPAGAGVATVTVGSAGTVKVKGTLADGTGLLCSGWLTAGDECYLYTRLPRKLGAIGGTLYFRDMPGESDVDSPSLHWTRPPAPGKAFYPDGWPGGVALTAVGSHYAPPAIRPAACVFTGLAATGQGGNLRAMLSGAGLATTLTHHLDLGADNRIAVLDPGADLLALKFARGAGTFTGSFKLTGQPKALKLHSVVLQKSTQAFGYFLTPTASGLLELAP